jgi:DNA helicase HerA-like ATPase
VKRKRDTAAHGKENLILFVVGRKGSGKSTLVRAIMEGYPRVFVIDTMEEYGAEDGFTVAADFSESLAAVNQAAETPGKFRISLRADIDDGDDLVSLVYTVPNCLLVVEETAFYCSPAYLPPALSRMVRTGRHREIDQIYVTQRPAAVSRDLTAAADIVVSFQAHEPRDLAYFRALAGDDGERVRNLPRFKVLAWGQVERAPMAVIERLDSRAE